MLGSSNILGPISSADTTNVSSEKVQAVFEAGAAISVGMVVMLAGSDTTGKKVIKTTTTIANCANLVVGIYEGLGGTGAETTTSGATGRDAVTGDTIYVTRYGKAAALVDGTTGAATTDGLILTMSTATAGVLNRQTTAVTNGVGHPFKALQANSGAAGGTISAVFVDL